MKKDDALNKLAWKAFVGQAPDMTAVKAIKRLRPHLISLGHRPDAIDERACAELLSRLEDLQRPSPRAEVNSFIRAFNTTLRHSGSSLSQLNFLPTVATERADAWAARPDLWADMQIFVAGFPGKLADNQLRAGVMRIAVIVEGAGLPPMHLNDLLSRKAIAAVIRDTSPNGLDQPSPARVHALYLLTQIANFRGNAEAIAFIMECKTSKSLKLQGHTAQIPTSTIDRIARYDDPGERDLLLQTVMRSLLVALQMKPTEANLYQAQAALAFQLAFFGGLSPSQLAACRFAQKDLGDGELVTRFQHGKAEASVNIGKRTQARVAQYRTWLSDHGLYPDYPFVTLAGGARPAKDIAHTFGHFLTSIGANLRPLDVRDFGCSELFRQKKGFSDVRAHLRASSTQNVANRLKKLRARALHLSNQEAAFARAKDHHVERR